MEHLCCQHARIGVVARAMIAIEQSDGLARDTDQIVDGTMLERRCFEGEAKTTQHAFV